MKKLSLVLAIVLLPTGLFAQIIANVRPARPAYTRVAPPSPRHIWVDEEWEPRGNAYVFTGGHWVAPPRPGVVWVPGHWRNRRHGWVWIPGHWR